jgi:tetratricopeptide (TPR) repeat protein
VTTTLDEDRRAVDARRSFATVRASIERHPLDYYSYAKAAELLDAGKDPRAILALNHALVLHPTHPDLHRMAARMLYRADFVSQAAIEYAAALRSSPQPAKLIGEIVALFPREQAAAALPLDYPELELLVRSLTDLGRTDVATSWLSRRLQQHPNQSRACEQLFLIITQHGNLEAARVATTYCPAMLPDFQTRLAIAQTLAKHGGHEEVIRLLQDVETWESRVDDKINGWLALCDAHRALEHPDDAKRCLRRLDASPDMRAERRGEIIQRLEAMQKPVELPGGVKLPSGSAATGSAAESP